MRVLLRAFVLTCVLHAFACSPQSPRIDTPPDRGQRADSDADISLADGVNVDKADMTELLDSEGFPPDKAVSKSDKGGLDAGRPVGDGGVGAACFLDEQCNDDMVCLDWKDGYCTALNCPTVGQCAEGSTCIDVGKSTTVCLAECKSQADCREHYGCKVFDDLDGEQVRGCYGLSDPASPPGGACQKHADCDGAGSCLNYVEEGYCAVVGCDAALSCPKQSVCVKFNGVPTCLRDCAVDDDCYVGGAKERRCAPLLDRENVVARVCLPAVEGVGVGSQCNVDIDCDSKQCRIVAEGKCTGSTLGCFDESDCPSGAVCEKAPAYVKGICTQACAGDISCPGQTMCIKTAVSSAWCQAPCSGLNDDSSCDSNLGESCVFGDPLTGVGNGKYVCTVLKSGDPGTTCIGNTDCKEGFCHKPENGLGTCAPKCGWDQSCPYPTTCVDTLAGYRCIKRCFQPLDCPPQMTCKTTQDSPQKICVP